MKTPKPTPVFSIRGRLSDIVPAAESEVKRRLRTAPGLPAQVCVINLINYP
jgi:hypothetical protein